MDYRILGPLVVEVDGTEIDLGPRKQKSLFALLLIHHNRTVPTDRILDALWGDEAHGKEKALWVYISRLRSALADVVPEPILLTRDHGYEVHIDPAELDAVRFERMAEEAMGARSSDPAHASEVLRTALALWRGSALEDFTYDEFARDEIQRLESIRRAALDARIEADLECGRSGELIGELETLVEAQPLDERPIRHLMVAMYRSGRQAEALRVFERFRRTLGEATGMEPSPELRRLEEQILFHDPHLSQSLGEAPAVSGASRNPYKGLEAFGEDDAHLFFGRDAVTAEILRRLSDHAIVTVVGPSGCGKSSVVRSGTIPAVRKGSLPGSDRWQIATMIPGRHPFVELEAALLRSTLDAPASLREMFDGSANEILRAGLRMLPSDDACLVVVIDQFEELFTLGDDAMTTRFLDAVVEASLDDRLRIRFLITLRADFYGRPLAHGRFGSAMGPGIVNVVPMAPEDLEVAASGPAQGAGVRLEPGLEAALIGDVLGEPGSLPLFEFALTDLFDRRVGDTLTLDAYRSMGGIEGAISRKAEHLYGSLTTDQQAAARQVFLRLVSLSDGETRSRRRVEAGELLSLDLDITDLQAVLDAFGKQRLILFDRNEASGSPTVEVSHEALLEHWDRLAGWIAEANEDLTTNARLTALASEWEEHDRAGSYLLSEGRYADYSTWADRSTMTLAGPEREYLEASRRAYEDREHAEAERVAREAATSRRARRTAWILAAVVAVVALVSAVLVWDATRPVGPRIVFVHGAGSSGINAMVEGGWIRAQQDLAFEAEEHRIMGRIPQRLEELAASGPDLIVGGLDFASYLGDLPKRYPDVHFAFLDTQPQWEETPPNVSILLFEDAHGSYLMGTAAAAATETGKVAMLTPAQMMWLQPGFTDAFTAGVQATDNDVEVVGAFISPRWLRNPVFDYWPEGWSSPSLAYEAAWDLFESGFDVVYTAAAGSGSGTIAAAADYAAATGERVWAIGVDIDEGFFTAEHQKDYVLTSMVKDFDLGLYEIVRRFVDGDLDAMQRLGLADGGVAYSTLNPAIASHVPLLEQTIAGLLDGSIEPVPVGTPPAHWRDEPDVTVAATVSTEVCAFDAMPVVRANDVLEVRVTNTASVPVSAWMGIIGEPSPDDPEDADTDPEVEEAPLASWTIPPGSSYALRSELMQGFVSTGLMCMWWDQEAESWGGMFSDPVPFTP